MLSLLWQNTFVMNMRYISRTAMLFLSRSWQCPESWWTAKRWENAWNSCQSVKWQLCPCCHLTHNSQLFLVTYANSQGCFMALGKCQHDDILPWKIWWQSYSIPLSSILPVPGVLQLSYPLLCHSYHPLPPNYLQPTALKYHVLWLQAAFTCISVGEVVSCTQDEKCKFPKDEQMRWWRERSPSFI